MSFDVVVIGEVLVEVCTDAPFDRADHARLGFSGDALNAAAAAAASGAGTALLARVPDDELGDALVRRVAELGIDTALIKRTPGQHGVYFVTADPSGARQFCYARKGSTGSTLALADLHRSGADRAPVILASGITCSLSSSAAAAVLQAATQAASSGRRFVYDPNYRPRLTTAEAAAEHLRRLAPCAAVVTPACPGETTALLGTGDPLQAAAACRALGAAAVAVTRGPDGVVLHDGDGCRQVPAVPPPALVDQTGAGDVFAGTVAGRLAQGDSLDTAVSLGAAAASLSLQGKGGTGHIPDLAATRAHLAGRTPASAPSPT